LRDELRDNLRMARDNERVKGDCEGGYRRT